MVAFLTFLQFKKVGIYAEPFAVVAVMRHYIGDLFERAAFRSFSEIAEHKAFMLCGRINTLIKFKDLVAGILGVYIFAAAGL